MVPGQPSRTALWVAVARGFARYESPPIADDPLAKDLVGGMYGAGLGLAGCVSPLTRIAVRALDILTGGRSRFMVYRTRVLDDVVREASRSGIDQLVILGAGLDARAWRLGEVVSGMDVFEVDHPDTQSYKRARLAGREAQSRSVAFVGINFETDALDAKLLAAGFDARRPAVVLWEGVVMYLPAPAIDATLATLRALLAPGSRLAISYSRTGVGSGALLRRAVGLVVRAAGEVFRHHEEPHEMGARVERCGFAVLWDEGHPDWAPRYASRPQTWDVQRVILAGG